MKYSKLFELQGKPLKALQKNRFNLKIVDSYFPDYSGDRSGGTARQFYNFYSAQDD